MLNEITVNESFLGALYEEAGPCWAFFSAAWNTLIAYTLAVICYQLGRFALHPGSSAAWLVSMTVLLVLGCGGLIALGRRRAGTSNLIPALNLD